MYKGAIVFRYDQITAAVNTIKGYAENYQSAGNSLIAAINNSTGDWEGASKIKFDQLINGGQGTVQEHVCKTIPNLITALAEMLAANAREMENADTTVANSLPGSL